jgi:CRP/FNR family transcriptional regulator
MLTNQQYEQAIQALAFLSEASPDALRSLKEQAFIARIPAGKDVFNEGDPAEHIALLISGIVRVYKIGETGREITLYRFGMGESCILTANAILSEQSFPAIATVEQDAEAVMVPSTAFREWIRRYDPWRDFFFELLSQRLAIMLSVVNEIAFRRMDSRVASLLLERYQARNPIAITHQEIAAELGSSREVVSRILEDFAARGLLRSARGAIELLDLAALQRRSVA